MFLRNKISYLAIGAIAIVFLAGILFFDYKKSDAPEARAAAGQNVRGFAWSENIGWISFNSTNCDPDGDNITEGGGNNIDYPQCPDGIAMDKTYGVNVDSVTKELSGYAWSSNIGWISFNRADAGVPPGAPYNGAETYIAKLDSSNNLTGWARALSNGGGWDGWIKLRKDPFAAPTYGVSLAGTDFTGFAWSDMVVGWISFNSKNCDSAFPLGQSDGGPGCPMLGTPVSAYKVYLAALLNNPPAVTPQPFTPLNYCSSHPWDIVFSWDFSDTEDDANLIDQSAYRLIVTKTDGINPPIVYNSGQVSGIGGNSTSITGAAINLSIPGFIDYGYSYTWTIEVWDSAGAPSGPENGAPFSTPLHAYPRANFTYVLPSPNVGLPVNFTDTSEAYGGANIVKWNWEFGDTNSLLITNPPSASGDTSHPYASAGSYTVTLTVEDDTPIAQGGPCICPKSQTINLAAPDLQWEEVTP